MRHIVLKKIQSNETKDKIQYYEEKSYKLNQCLRLNIVHSSPVDC